MATERLFIPGPVGQLQAIYRPGEIGKPAVVVCHPHPLYDGTMNNKVVYWIAQAFAEQGCAVLRFNFRGVEESDGEWGDGVGESEDAAAALDWLNSKHTDEKLWIAGFSFGCYAGLRAAQNNARVSRLFAIAPAVNHYDFSFMKGDTRPLTVVMGAEDEIVPFNEVETWSSSMAQVTFVPINEAGHFFPQHKQQLVDTLVAEAFDY